MLKRPLREVVKEIGDEIGYSELEGQYDVLREHDQRPTINQRLDFIMEHLGIEYEYVPKRNASVKMVLKKPVGKK